MTRSSPHDRTGDQDYSPSYLINEQAEYEDMNERGKEAYRACKRRQRRFHTGIIAAGVTTTIAGLTIGPWWLVFGAAFAVSSLAMLFNSGPDIQALAQGRLAERDPPEQLSWEEHVKKYGHRNGEPLTEEEEQALITGEVDDPEWRAEHLDSDK